MRRRTPCLGWNLTSYRNSGTLLRFLGRLPWRNILAEDLVLAHCDSNGRAVGATRRRQRKLFLQHLFKGQDAQLVVVHGGESILDLWEDFVVIIIRTLCHLEQCVREGTANCLCGSHDPSILL